MENGEAVEERGGGRAAAFLGEAEDDPSVRKMYDENVAESGYVMNLTRVWAHQPRALEHLSAMLRDAASAAGLSMRDRGILVAATASTIEDSYCSLAWGGRPLQPTSSRCEPPGSPTGSWWR